MARLLTLLAAITAVPLLTLAALALAGVAAVRQPEPAVVAVATSLLLLLPVLGFSVLLPWRRAGLLLGANAWPLLLLVGLPLYFPGERSGAINTGLALLGLPLGEPLPAEQRQAVAEAIDDLLVQPRARAPSPQAAPAEEAAPPPSRMAVDSDHVALPDEGRGPSLLIPVSIEGPDGEILEVEMLFDTGATYTTLDPVNLHRAGYRLPADAPRISFQTAAGESESSLVTIERLWLGGFEVPGVTVAICESCSASGDHAGLLGLNVSGRFLITLDTARQEVILEPRTDGGRAHLDLRPWLDIEGRGTSWPDGRTEVMVRGRNLADRDMAAALVEIRCAGERFEVQLGSIPARELREVQVTVPAPTDCDPFSLDLVHGSW